MSRRGVIHLCSFSVGLDELPRLKQKDERAVLEVIEQAGRFSVFEASANQVIAGTVTRLFKRGLIQKRGDGGAYPWHNVELTEAGAKLLALDRIERGEEHLLPKAKERR